MHLAEDQLPAAKNLPVNYKFQVEEFSEEFWTLSLIRIEPTYKRARLWGIPIGPKNVREYVEHVENRRLIPPHDADAVAKMNSYAEEMLRRLSAERRAGETLVRRLGDHVRGGVPRGL